jgi:hypothetical protein
MHDQENKHCINKDIIIEQDWPKKGDVRQQLVRAHSGKMPGEFSS